MPFTLVKGHALQVLCALQNYLFPWRNGCMHICRDGWMTSHYCFIVLVSSVDFVSFDKF